MRISDLFEGVKVGAKEKAKAISRADVMMGIEYEFRGHLKGKSSFDTRKMKVEDLQKILKDRNITFDKVIPEHAHQLEVVTHKMPLADGMKHLSNMFDLLKTNDDTMQFTIDEDASGLHISISLKDAQKTFNPLKFLLLVNTTYIADIFPEREHTTNNDTILDSLPTIMNIGTYDVTNDKNELYRFEADLINDISGNNTRIDSQTLKYAAVKLSDYANFDGRIELRFFGGENYLNFKLIKDQVARALYFLDIAHGDKFDKEYKKLLYALYTRKRSDSHGGLLSDLDQPTVSATTKRELFDKWQGLNSQKLPTAGVLIRHYISLLPYIKTHFPKSYQANQRNIKEVLTNLSKRSETDIVRTLVASPMVMNEFIDLIIETGMHLRLNISSVSEETANAISLSTWSKLLEIDDIGTIDLTTMPDPLNPSREETTILSNLLPVYSITKQKDIHRLLLDYAEIIERDVHTYDAFEKLPSTVKKVVNATKPGFMEELMLRELGL